MEVYETLSTLPEEKRKTIRENLLTYCKLDTWAMVKIWQWLEKKNEA
jgi:hypothetical protein